MAIPIDYLRLFEILKMTVLFPQFQRLPYQVLRKLGKTSLSQNLAVMTAFEIIWDDRLR